MATQMLEAGVPIVTVSRRLAHRRVSTTLDRYAHSVPGGDAQASAVLRAVVETAAKDAAATTTVVEIGDGEPVRDGSRCRVRVAASQVLDECVTADHDRCCPIRLEPPHWSEPRFESAVITFNAIIGVPLGVVERIGDEFFDDGLEGLGEIGDDFVGFTVSVERSSEEPVCCDEVASAGNVYVDDGCWQLGRVGRRLGRRTARWWGPSRRFRRRTSVCQRCAGMVVLRR